MSAATPPEPEVAFLDGQQDAWRAQLPASGWAELARTLGLDEYVTAFVLEGHGDADAIAARIVKPTGAAIGVWRKRPWLDLVLGLGPGPVARLLELRGVSLRATSEALAGFVAVFTLDAVEALVRLPDALVDDALPALMPLGDVRLVDLVARRWTQLEPTNRGRAAAAWFTAHPTHAAWGLVGSAREMTTGRAHAARAALRAFAGSALDALIHDAARNLGVDVATLVARDDVPAPPVQLPAYWKAVRARLVAITGDDLPAADAEALATLLATGKARATELDAVRARCTEDSLRQFALDVFAAYMHKSGSKNLVLWPAALIAFGGDPAVVEIAHALHDDRFRDAPLARAACDVLAAIGSPLAIAELVRVAAVTRALDDWSELEPTASDTLDSVAAERRLMRDELEDRAVAALDGAEHHANIIAAAHSAWLERALRERRRIPRAALLGWVRAHPTFRHMARQLVWSTCSDDGVITSPAVIEGGELRGVLGASSITDGPHLRLAHPLDLDPEVRGRCQEAARARGLRPAIPQLEREAFVLTADEASSDALARFAGRKLGLGRRLPLGWRRGPVLNAIMSRLERPYPGGIIAALHHSDLDLGDAPPRTITLRALTFERSGHPISSLGDIDPVTMSETIRDIELMLPPRRSR